MASYARCICFLLLLCLFFSLQTQARESKFFSKFSTKNSKENHESISLSPVGLPTLAPAPAPDSESEVVEHGYGLYGSESYRYPPTTKDPVKTPSLVGEEKYVPAEELNKHNFEEFEMGYTNNNFNGNGNEKQGMSDTRFLENGKYYYDVNNEAKDENTHEGNRNGYGNEKQRVIEYANYENMGNGNGNGNGYVSERQGMSDTRFMENGKYYYDVNKDVKDENTYKGNGNGYMSERQGMSDTRFMENGKYYYDVNKDVKDKNIYKGNGNGNEYVSEKQGTSDDTRFMENGKYYDVNNGAKNENGYHGGNKWNGNGYETKKQGMSDTRFLENGKYYYDVNNEKGDMKNNYSNNQEYVGSLDNGNGYEREKEQYSGNNGYETEERGRYNYNAHEYEIEGRGEYKVSSKKLPPNEYDSIEEYEKEQEYRQSQNEYVP